MMINYYFFKENNRLYNKTELIDFLNTYETIYLDNSIPNTIYYFNESLNFKSEFIMFEKSQVSNIHTLNPKYLDTNLVLQFDVLTPSYKLKKLLLIVEEMCAKFNFFIYNEIFMDVSDFRRNIVINSFDLIKKAYKEKHSDELSDYTYVNKLNLDVIYSYLENKNVLIEKYKKDNYDCLDYHFYKIENGKKAFISVTWNAKSPFVFPSNIDLFVFDDGINKQFISFKEFFPKISKLVTLIDASVYGIYKLEVKNLKKVKKILQKTTFTKLKVELIEISIDNILDIEGE